MGDTLNSGGDGGGGSSSSGGGGSARPAPRPLPDLLCFGGMVDGVGETVADDVSLSGDTLSGDDLDDLDDDDGVEPVEPVEPVELVGSVEPVAPPGGVGDVEPAPRIPPPRTLLPCPAAAAPVAAAASAANEENQTQWAAGAILQRPGKSEGPPCRTTVQTETAR